MVGEGIYVLMVGEGIYVLMVGEGIYVLMVGEGIYVLQQISSSAPNFLVLQIYLAISSLW